MKRIIHLRTLHLGPDDVLLAAKLEFACDDMPSLADAIDTVEARVRASTPIVRLIYFEPDLYDADAAPSQEEAPMTDSSDATVAAVDRFNEAFNRHDVDAVMAAMTDDCVFENTSPPNGQRYEGQDAGARRRGRSSSPRRPPRTSTARTSSRPATAASCSGATRGRTTTARPSALRGVDVIRVRDGKVAEKFAYVKG